MAKSPAVGRPLQEVFSKILRDFRNLYLTCGQRPIIIYCAVVIMLLVLSQPHSDPGVAQLVARLVRDQEAVGSNPATRTTGNPRILLKYEDFS